MSDGNALDVIEQLKERYEQAVEDRQAALDDGNGEVAAHFEGKQAGLIQAIGVVNKRTQDTDTDQ